MLLYLQADVSSAHGKFLNGDSINGQILKKVFKILPLNQELVSFHLQIMNQANTVCPDIVMFQNFFFFGGQGIYDHCSLFMLSFIFSLNQVKTCDTVLLSQSD